MPAIARSSRNRRRVESERGLIVVVITERSRNATQRPQRKAKNTTGADAHIERPCHATNGTEPCPGSSWARRGLALTTPHRSAGRYQAETQGNASVRCPVTSATNRTRERNTRSDRDRHLLGSHATLSKSREIGRVDFDEPSGQQRHCHHKTARHVPVRRIDTDAQTAGTLEDKKHGLGPGGLGAGPRVRRLATRSSAREATKVTRPGRD